ncbi:M15 family metallopeptidase [Rhizobium sp. PAMB 3182]
MAISLNGLDPAFRAKVNDLLHVLNSLGVEMRPYFGLRTVEEQARLWRQSRSTESINHEIGRLKASGAPFLADVLNRVGPTHGPHVTNALPGLSWHQWGEAIDCVWITGGVAEWSASKLVNGVNGYKLYATKAKEAGLNAGGFWSSFKDWPHVQLRQFGSPAGAGMTFPEIDAEMKKRYGP